MMDPYQRRALRETIAIWEKLAATGGFLSSPNDRLCHYYKNRWGNCKPACPLILPNNRRCAAGLFGVWVFLQAKDISTRKRVALAILVLLRCSENEERQKRKGK